jgi:L-threonylcarbamoyladenylate synthase
MNTELLLIDQFDPDPKLIDQAAKLIRSGGLVAFPTETVYGLGANALDAAAVRGIFEAKGRPSSNPLIVHVAEPSQIVNVARVLPETARTLAERFWPGSLTIVLDKLAHVPDEVTAGGPTVAVRCPNHAVAQALIRASGVPIAAPSANRSSELSPTRAEHVWHSLGGRIDAILDGGSCPGGIESTVVDATGTEVVLLRPGLISVAMLESVVGKVVLANSNEPIARSPGRLAKHYSPRTKLRLVDGTRMKVEMSDLTRAGFRVGIVTFGTSGGLSPIAEQAASRHVDLTDNVGLATMQLYHTLHLLDEANLDVILVQAPSEVPEWDAIRDRLTRAAFEGE